MHKDVATKNMTSMFSRKGLNPVSIKNYQTKLEKHQKRIERKVKKRNKS